MALTGRRGGKKKSDFPKIARLEGWGVPVTNDTVANFSFTDKLSKKHKPI